MEEHVTSLTVTEIINRIIAGEKISKISLETGITIHSLSQLLIKNNIYNNGILAQHSRDIINKEFSLVKRNHAYTLHADEAERKLLIDAMISDVNRIWNTLNRKPKFCDINLHGYFKTDDHKMVFSRITLLLYVTQRARLNNCECFLTETEIVAYYNKFSQSMRVLNSREEKASIQSEHKKLILIAELKELEKEFGRAPVKKEVYKNGIYMRCYRAFGSYKTALKEAGIKSAKEARKEEAIARYDNIKAEKAALIEQLKKLQTQLGREPLPHEIEPGVPYEKTKLASYFPSFIYACKKAGFSENYSFAGKYFTMQQMLEMLKNLSAVLGRTPSNKDVTLHLPFSAMAFSRRFGSLGKALLQAGVIDKENFERNYLSFSLRKKAKMQLQDV